MLQRALHDDAFDVIMVGFNLLNQQARDTVLEAAMRKDTGVLIMFAIRRALSRMEKLRLALRELIDLGELDAADIDLDSPLGFLLEEGAASSIPDAAYRFCRDEPGVHVVLSGTGNPQHLASNIASLQGPPLSPEHVERLKHIFRNAKKRNRGMKRAGLSTCPCFFARMSVGASGQRPSSHNRTSSPAPDRAGQYRC